MARAELSHPSVEENIILSNKLKSISLDQINDTSHPFKHVVDNQDYRTSDYHIFLQHREVKSTLQTTFPVDINNLGETYGQKLSFNDLRDTNPYGIGIKGIGLQNGNTIPDKENISITKPSISGYHKNEMYSTLSKPFGFDEELDTIEDMKEDLRAMYDLCLTSITECSIRTDGEEHIEYELKFKEINDVNAVVQDDSDNESVLGDYSKSIAKYCDIESNDFNTGSTTLSILKENSEPFHSLVKSFLSTNVEKEILNEPVNSTQQATELKQENDWEKNKNKEKRKHKLRRAFQVVYKFAIQRPIKMSMFKK